MWELATQEINSHIYRFNTNLKAIISEYGLLTAYPPYNEAYLHPDTPEIRKKLFVSYEQLDNKN